MRRRLLFDERFRRLRTPYLAALALCHVGVRGAADYFAAKTRTDDGADRPACIRLRHHASLALRNCRTDLAIFEQVFLLGDCALPVRHPPVRYVIDAGAHIGCSSLYYALRFPQARILAVEAERSNFEQLTHNVGAYPRITPLHAAVFHRNGEVAIVNPTDQPWGFRVGELPAGEAPGGPLTRAMTMNALMAHAGFPHVDLLKLDVEGEEAELFAAPEAAEWLRRVRVMTVELHDRIRPDCTAAFRQAVSALPHSTANTLNNVIWINRSLPS